MKDILAFSLIILLLVILVILGYILPLVNPF